MLLKRIRNFRVRRWLFFSIMKRVTVIEYLLLVVIFLGFIIFESCGSKNPPKATQGPPVVSVTTQHASFSNAVYYDEYPAIVTALSQVELRPQVNGLVTGIYFKDGDRVRKGQRLYSIDQQQYEANYQQAVANLQVQQSNLLKAQKDAERYHELDKQDAIAKQQVDYADAALEVAKKQVDAAKANVRGVQTGVKYTNISAPFDGTIGISLVKLGASVVAGQSILNTVSSDNPLAVDFSVDQKEIYRFTQLQQQGTNKVDSIFRLGFGSSLYPYPGKISMIDRAVDPTTSTIKIRLEFPNEKKLLRAGMSGTVKVLNAFGQTILIPYKAVTEQLGEYFVYVVIGDKVTQRKVMLGKQVGNNIIVREGLKEQEQIVVEGVQNLREGSSIKINNNPQGTPAK
jgi:membrane fusion protein (multidrug efflux system)